MSDSPRPSDWRNDAALVLRDLELPPTATYLFSDEEHREEARAALARLVALLDQQAPIIEAARRMVEMGDGNDTEAWADAQDALVAAVRDAGVPDA